MSDLLIETRVQLVVEKLTVEFDCTSATRVLVIRSYTDG